MRDAADDAHYEARLLSLPTFLVPVRPACRFLFLNLISQERELAGVQCLLQCILGDFEYGWLAPKDIVHFLDFLVAELVLSEIFRRELRGDSLQLADLGLWNV